MPVNLNITYSGRFVFWKLACTLTYKPCISIINPYPTFGQQNGFMCSISYYSAVLADVLHECCSPVSHIGSSFSRVLGCLGVSEVGVHDCN